MLRFGNAARSVAGRAKALALCGDLRPARRPGEARLGNAMRGAPARAQFTQAEAVFNGTNAAYIEEMFRVWKQDPSKVHASWDAYFRTGQVAAPPPLVTDAAATVGAAAARPAVGAPDDSLVARVIQMIRAFQVRGHFLAKLDPLGIDKQRRGFLSAPKELSLEYYGFQEADMDRAVNINMTNVKGFLSRMGKQLTLRQLYSRLQEIYTGTVGVEYMHIHDVEQCNWIRERFETPEAFEWSTAKRERVLERLLYASELESLLARKHGTAKRFGLEGAESFIPGLKAVLDTAADLGAREVVMGMPHRGRLNVLLNVMRMPMEDIFLQFLGSHEESAGEGTGDVKYHLGWDMERQLGHGPETQRKPVTLSLLPNPSHLEAVDPVVCGNARARMDERKDAKGDQVWNVLLHGDAAFAAQGVVYETLAMNELPNYQNGGTIHIIVNNQIGFTTDPFVARSTPYCTAVAKGVGCPIFHVNGDDPEAVVRVCEIAAQWRQEFKKDVVVDIICYRKHGHNEVDEPRFTQPLMYKAIGKQTPVTAQYSQRLVDAKVITAERAASMQAEVARVIDERYRTAQKKAQAAQQASHHAAGAHGNGAQPLNGELADAVRRQNDTGVAPEALREIGMKLTELPAGFAAHPKIVTFVNERRNYVTSGHNLDFSTAEALAFASLLRDGKTVRLSGQDVERGTFTHRHGVFTDQESGSKYMPLSRFGQATISNSLLSEFGVLGFELGYNWVNPNKHLVLWEAQFGDFANGAQVIIDQFLSSGEAKWRKPSSLVLLLPHGFEGQGPEHSSARLERFLQGSMERPDVASDHNHPGVNNWFVVNVSTPANYFHLLRRQTRLVKPKPLIVMTHKNLLRAPAARSALTELAPGTHFQPFLPDTGAPNPAKVERLVLCSGRIYYDLVAVRARGLDPKAEPKKELAFPNVAIARVEQLSPFPFELVRQEMARFPKAEVVWAQEEPMNMGAWAHVQPRVFTASGGKVWPVYVGRPPSAATATGHPHQHAEEEAAIRAGVFAPKSARK
jgi:2-oxoglutarate dehydrogenase E1 component